MRKLNPGDLAPQSGSYAVCDARGHRMATVRVQKGEHCHQRNLANTITNMKNNYCK